MTIAETYASLAGMLDYPAGKEELLADHDRVNAFLGENRLGCSIDSFANFVAASPLATLQEEYVGTFDFNPATSPYLGHHLFGDNQKKGGYMIGLKQEFGRYGYTPPGNELPDHLSVVLGFLAHMAREGSGNARRKFIAESVLPGMERLSAVFADRQDLPWKPVIEVARQLCTADCKEADPC